MTEFSHILMEQPTDALARVTLHRPEASNALNQALAEQMAEIFQRLARNNAIRCIILTGAGDRAFCAGADLKERQGMDETAWQRQHHALKAARQALLHCPTPIIAAVNGAAMGGGLELALCCDFIYAAEHARFALTEASLGIMPGMGGTQTLPRAIGSRKAKEFLFTATTCSADEALRMGFVNRVVPKEALRDAVEATARQIAANAPRAVAAIKQSVDKGLHEPLATALETESALYQTLIPTHDRKEGIQAWAEKRRPQFTGA